jgi:hypothetical protein
LRHKLVKLRLFHRRLPARESPQTGDSNIKTKQSQMKSLTAALLATALIAVSGPAFAAKSDCDAGFKGFMTKMSVFVDKTSGDALADAIRKGLDGYTSCTAGDSFTVHGVWDQIVADMQKKSGQ